MKTTRVPSTFASLVFLALIDHGGSSYISEVGDGACGKLPTLVSLGERLYFVCISQTAIR